MNVIDCHTDVIYCMSLNRDGSFLATTCKDKKLRVIEPRTGMIISVSKNNIVILQSDEISKIMNLSIKICLLSVRNK